MGSSALASRVSFVDRLNAFRERFGIKGAIFKSIDVVLHKVLRAYIHTVVWLELEPVAKMACSDPRFTFRFLTADEIESFAKEPSYFIDPSLAGGVRDGREVCFAALEGDRLAAFGCYTLGFVPPEQCAGAALSFPADVAYMSYGFTHPDFRGARLHGYIMGLALQELAKRGVTKLVSIVAWTNWASLKSCWRLGYINLGNMITIGGKKRAIGLYPKAAKKLGVRFGRKAVKPA
jgi:GNAT superfamily N-acetyltransferase